MIQPKETVNRKQILELLNINQMISDYLAPAYKTKKAVNNRYDQNTMNETGRSTKINIIKKMQKKQNVSASLIKVQVNKPEKATNVSQRCFRAASQSQSNFQTGNKTISSSLYKLQRKIPVNSNKKRLMLKNSINTSSTLEYTNINENKDATIQCNGNKNEKVKKQDKILFSGRSRTISCPKFQKKQGKKKKTLIKDRYQLQNIIGRGLSGVVYQAKDILSDRAIAIKIISESCKEYEYIKQLQHKNIIEYYNSFVQQGKRYLILQYMPETLRTLLKKRKLGESEIKTIFRQIVDAVVYLHGSSIAHRDIKLENILVSDDLLVKFIDFGMCINVQQSTLTPLQFCGTINYMAPEVIRGQKSDPRKSDIWSLGIILYALAIGRLPFHAKAENQIYKRAITKKQIYPQHMSKELKNLIDNMLQKQSNKRISILQIMHHKWLSQQ